MNELDEALAAWGATGVRLIKDRENAVYEVALDGQRAALRLHRVGYQSAAAIMSELTWMEALAGAGISVPAPIYTRDGTGVMTLKTGRLATMVSWVNGMPLGADGVPLAGSASDQEAVFRTIGRAVAKLHNVTDGLVLPKGFERHAWDGEGLLGENPFWGRFWESPALDSDERALILRARAVAVDRLRMFREGGGDYGLIHADILRENVFVDQGRVTLIDFDDAGFGFRLYDLATLMSQNEGLKNSDALREAAVAGYRAVRPLPDEAEALLPMFVMLRRFASMGWVVPRTSSLTDMRLYAGRALNAAQVFLSSVA
ncbi:MAG: phosphotransferase [Rhodobacteraceae bacterium]|nr:phosphotransferase [Paracoccaceae bacterium]